MLRNVLPGEIVGRGRDWLSAHVWLSVERSWDVPIMLRGASQTQKSAFNMFSTDEVLGNGLVGNNLCC